MGELCTYTCKIKVLLSYDNEYGHTGSPSLVLYLFPYGFLISPGTRCTHTWLIVPTNTVLAMTLCTYAYTWDSARQYIMLTWACSEWLLTYVLPSINPATLCLLASFHCLLVTVCVVCVGSLYNMSKLPVLPPIYPIIPPSCVRCCQGNLDWPASRKQDLITICHPLLSPPFSIPTSVLLCLHKPLLSFHLRTTPSRQKQEKCGCLIDVWDRVLTVCCFKFSLSESVWSSWPAETKQAESGSTVITSP